METDITSTTLFAWGTPQYHQPKRHWAWTLLVLLGSLAAAGAAAFFGNYLFGALLLIAGIIILYVAHKPAEQLSIKISDRGVHVEDQLLPYDEIMGFSIVGDDHYGRLLLATPLERDEHIVIYLASSLNPHKLADTLQDYIPEIDLPTPLADKIVDQIGF